MNGPQEMNNKIILAQERLIAILESDIKKRDKIIEIQQDLIVKMSKDLLLLTSQTVTYGTIYEDIIKFKESK